MTWRYSVLLGCALATAGLACDLEPKNIGDEPSDEGNDDGMDDGVDDGSGEDPFASPRVAICADDVPRHELMIQSAAIDGDNLLLEVSHGGGCEPHEFGLCWDGAFLESEPVQARLFVAHENNGDACEALLTAELELDLSPLRESYEQGYQTMTGNISLNLIEWDGELLYSF